MLSEATRIHYVRTWPPRDLTTSGRPSELRLPEYEPNHIHLNGQVLVHTKINQFIRNCECIRLAIGTPPLALNVRYDNDKERGG